MLLVSLNTGSVKMTPGRSNLSRKGGTFMCRYSSTLERDRYTHTPHAEKSGTYMCPPIGITQRLRTTRAYLYFSFYSQFFKILLTMEHRRAFPFHGSDEEYVSYLEAELLKALKPETQQSSTTRSPICEELKVLYYDPYTSKDSEEPPNYENCKGEMSASYARANFSRDALDVDKAVGAAHDPSIASQERRELDSFLRQIKSAISWEKKKKLVRLSSPENNRFVMQILCGKAWGTYKHGEDRQRDLLSLSDKDHCELVRRGCDYGELGKLSRVNGEMILLAAKFQQLVFVSYCSVLLHIGISKDTVDWMLRRYVADVTAGSLKRIRLGSTWVNRCIAKLLTNGWGFRSWELFLLCMCEVDNIF